MERVTRVTANTPQGNVRAIITDKNEYASTEHPNVWRRCSDNVRGEIIVRDEPQMIDFLVIV